MLASFQGVRRHRTLASARVYLFFVLFVGLAVLLLQGTSLLTIWDHPAFKRGVAEGCKGRECSDWHSKRSLWINFEHLTMDMSMGNMNMGSSPAPSASSMSESSSSGSNSMMMMMQMYFEATTSVTLWFKEWKTDTSGKYAGSIIGLLLLCLLQEGISRGRLLATRRWAGSSFRSLDSSSEAGHPDPVFSFASYGRHLPTRIGLTALYALNVTTSYLLMLAVMTFNVGYFITVVAGLALGHFIFFPASQARDSPGMLSEACCPQS